VWLDRFELDGFGDPIAVILRERMAELRSPGSKIARIRLQVDGRRKRRVQTRFADWDTVPSSDYLRLVGRTYRASLCHTVYRFKIGKLVVFLPALVLARVLFRLNQTVAEYLLSLQGLDFLCAPILNADGTAAIALWKRIIGRNTLLPQDYLEPFRWLCCYPSARRSWDSMYQESRRGRVSMTLPLATVEMTVGGQLVGNTLCATNARIATLKAEEEPYSFAANQQRTFTFSACSPPVDGKSSAQAGSRDQTIRPNGSSWALSDAEWAEIERLFPFCFAPNPRRYSLRGIFDGIVEKLGTGQPWSHVTWPSANAAYGAVLYSNCRRDGRWEAIKEILSRHRTTTP
jgi:hypothetical protein